MRHKQYFFKMVLLLLLAISISSCSEKAFDEVSRHPDFNHLSAKMFFENNISTLKVPNMFLSKVVETRTSDLHFNEYNINWDKFNFSENEEDYIYEFGLSTKGYDLLPALFTNDNGKISYVEQDTKIMSSLVIMKSKKTDKLMIFVNTLVGYMINDKELCAFNEDKTDFRGFQIFSDCAGNYLPSGYLYEEKGAYQLYLKKYESAELSQLPSIFFRLCLNVETKGYGEQENNNNGLCHLCGFKNDSDDVRCFMCGTWLYSGSDGPIGGGVECPHCGMNPCICNICMRCGYDPCVCPDPNDGCIYCYSIDCAGECRN